MEGYVTSPRNTGRKLAEGPRTADDSNSSLNDCRRQHSQQQRGPAQR